MADDKIVTKKTVAKKSASKKTASKKAAPKNETISESKATTSTDAKTSESAAKKTSAKPATKKTAAKAASAPKTTKKTAPTPASAQPAERSGSLHQLANVPPGERAKMIEEAAYYRAEKRNFAPGHEEEDWAMAEREIDELIARARQMTGR